MKKIHIIIISMLAAVLAVAGVFSTIVYLKNIRLSKDNERLESIIQQVESEKQKLENDVESLTATETETETEKETVMETEPVDIRNDKKIAIDPGHQSFKVNMSAKEPLGPGSLEMKAKASTGTTGRFTGVPEYELNLNISKQLRTELEARGYEVVLTREDHETAISNKERALLAYESGADIYVRIHANGSENSSVNGAMTMVPSKNNPFVANLHEESYKLGEKVINSYCEATGMKNNGVHLYDNMTGINWSKIPVFIIEMGYMTNEKDDRNMQDSEYQKKMVKGIADGIDTYFGFSKTSGEVMNNETKGEEEISMIIERDVKAILSKRMSQGEQWSVFFKKADGSHQVTVGNNKMKAASLIKLYIMGAVYENYDRLSQTYGAATIDRLIEPMITVSDNASANELTKMLGGGEEVKGREVVNTYCQTHGYTNTAMGRMLLEVNPSGDNYTSVSDCGKFLSDVLNKTLDGSDLMIGLMKKQQRTGKIPAGVPDNIVTANKTGELSDVENDVAIVYAPQGSYILCVMSQDLNSTGAARDIITDISRLIYKDFQ